MSSFQDLIKGEKPILVDFYADWCAPCKAMNPILKSVKSKMGDQIKILKINGSKIFIILEDILISFFFNIELKIIFL